MNTRNPAQPTANLPAAAATATATGAGERSLEQRLAEALLGRPRASALMTDAYKLSMAQAGFPLRPETFYLSFRKPGPYWIPFDLEALVRGLLPAEPTEDEREYLESCGLTLSPAMDEALRGEVTITAPTKGAWVFGREPVLSITGPSFLVSWLEPLVVALHFPVQVATAARQGRTSFVAAHASEVEIVRLAAGTAGVTPEVELRSEDYVTLVTAAAQRLVDAVGGDASRLFEVGLRGATCIDQHLSALRACAQVGLGGTSHVHGARLLGLTPVGTAGHEHQQRWREDARAYRALRDTRPQAPSYLLDTYDTMELGLPAALEVMGETPERAVSVRFDSGDQEAQLRHAVALFGDAEPSFVFEDGYDAERTRRMEELSEELGIAPRRRLYGYGSELIARTAFTDLTRDRAGAVYKLTRTAEHPVMKFSESGKQSAPGRPVVFRRCEESDGEPVGLIGQDGETPPAGYALLGDLPPTEAPPAGDVRVENGPATRALVEELRNERDARLAATRG